jgi:O-antigen/teichoic acid export membrane protein
MSLRTIKESIFNLGALFISKAGGVLVVLFFMPLFLKILGVEQFGIVAVILSMQALLMMLDLGTSTLISRDVAIFGKDSVNSFSIWRNSEVLLTTFYVLVLPFAIFACLLGIFGTLSVFSTVLLVFLFWAMVLQNLSQTVLLSTNSFKTASVIQLIGGLARAGFTVLLLKKIGATIAVFIIAQLFIATLQLLVTRMICNSIFSEIEKIKIPIKEVIENCVNLLKRSKSLLLFGLAGAAVMQLDKPIIATFISAKEVSTYFLAMTFCMVPVGVLAGPVVQYFQPKIILSLSQFNQKDTEKLILNFILVLLLVTLTPSMVLSEYSEYWLRIWLGESNLIVQINLYVKILIFGVTIGTIGYIPVVFLTASQDYKFQAVLAVLLAVVVLTVIFIVSYYGRIDFICWAYVFYYTFATIASWVRSLKLSHLKVNSKLALKYVFLITISLVFLNTLIFKIASFVYERISNFN